MACDTHRIVVPSGRESGRALALVEALILSAVASSALPGLVGVVVWAGVRLAIQSGIAAYDVAVALVTMTSEAPNERAAACATMIPMSGAVSTPAPARVPHLLRPAEASA
jgi:hypothetical protein